MDSAIMKKRLEIQEALGKPTKVKRTMRIFISNSAADQPHEEEQEEEEEEEGHMFEINSENEPSWTLKIEGRLLDVKKKDNIMNRETITYFNNSH